MKYEAAVQTLLTAGMTVLSAGREPWRFLFLNRYGKQGN